MFIVHDCKKSMQKFAYHLCFRLCEYSEKIGISNANAKGHLLWLCSPDLFQTISII